MAYGILFAQKVYRRTTVVKDAMCKSSLSEEDRKILISNINLQKYINVSSRMSIIPIFFVLYKRGFFDKPSPYFIRDILLATCVVVGLSLADYGSNEYMWMNSTEILKKYGAYNEDYYLDGKAFERMQNKYKSNKLEEPGRMEQFKKEQLGKIVSKSDKIISKTQNLLPMNQSNLESKSSKDREDSLSIVKKARKQAEEDARLLANRIALLKQEELRTIKKINETTRKAMEIYKIKEQNERRWFQRNKELQQIKSHKRDMFVNHSEDIKKQNEQRKKKIEEVFQMKKGQTNETKKLLEEQRAFRESNLRQMQEENAKKFKNVKRERVERRQKIQRFLTQKKEMYKQESEKEMQSHEKVKQEKIDEINKLEKVEMELLDKLQRTQKVQVEAYEKLESAINLPPQEFKKKYEDEIKNKDPLGETSVMKKKEHKEEEKKSNEEKKEPEKQENKKENE